MKKIINNFIGNYSSKEVKRIMPLVEKIKALDKEISKYTDERLRELARGLKERLEKGGTLDEILVEAFALVREASFRVLGMKHYDVQILGGIILHQGRVAEMKTGEGKTLVSALPAFLNALTGRGVHVITSNEYLAKRDCEEIGKIHEFLGLTTGVILHDMKSEKRREIYKKDIVYGINSEIGFDYLKDNMVKSKENRVQRGLNYAIIDEIDSILIDEARTPLIISGEGTEPTEYYIEIDEFVKKLKKDKDFEVDDKKKAVTLTEKGIEKIEKHFKIDNYSDLENINLQHHIVQAMRANYTMVKDIDYIINKDDEVLIVDTGTGRVMDGRRFSDGLHQAIEAKEGVDIQEESETMATITLQNLFRLYNKLSGMSGTVNTEEKEFRDIYSLDVIVVPTNKPVQRIDNKDKVYVDIKSKYYAVVEDIIKTHKTGQPILVGTSSIQKSEDISAILKRRNIPHNVLNAKNHEMEAKIVERAGEKGAITIATNMAGRGTDIKLTKEAYDLGGLKVIGTEKHDSRRVDNQLRGRSGRQGDVGESVFYVSLEDDIIKNYMSSKYKKIMEKLDRSEDGEIKHKSAIISVENAQKAIEGDSFESRKSIVGYDDAINKQRKVIYEQRNRVLDSEDVEEDIINMINYSVKDLLDNSIENEEITKEAVEQIKKSLIENFYFNKEDIESLVIGSKVKYLLSEIEKVIIRKYLLFKNNNEETLKDFERIVLLDTVDSFWIEYIKELEYLRQGINLRSYKQVDPVQEFQIESSKMFNHMSQNIKVATVKNLLKYVDENNKALALV